MSRVLQEKPPDFLIDYAEWLTLLGTVSSIQIYSEVLDELEERGVTHSLPPASTLVPDWTLA